MTARIPQIRSKTARELADKFGVTPRTIRNHMAAPRNWWEEQRRALRAKAISLRETGMTWQQIGEALGCSSEAARALGRRARAERTNAPSDSNTGDLFAQGSAQ